MCKGEADNMELIKKKIGKYVPVISKEEISEMSVEAIVPDSISDILKISAALADVTISGKDVQTDRVLVKGMCRVSVVCTAENEGAGVVIPVSLPLSHVMAIQGCTSDSKAEIDIRIKECTAHIINSRKISVKAVVIISVRIYNCVETELTKGIEETEGVFCLEKSVCDEYISSIIEKQVRIAESVSLDRGLVPLKCQSGVDIEDVKVIKGKAMIRGNCVLKVAFMCRETGDIRTEKYHLPFSCVAEDDCLENGKKLEISAVTAQADISVSESAGGSVLGCDICVILTIKCIEEIEEKILCDVFSSVYEMKTEAVQISANGKSDTDAQRKNISRVFENIVDAEKVCDFTDTIISTLTGENLLDSSIYLCVVYKSREGEIESVQLKHDVSYEIPGSFMDAEAVLENVSVECTDGGNIKLECEIVYLIRRGGTIPVSQITKCELLKDCPKKRSTAATLILRNVAKGESVWDIAKKYSTSPAAILEANKLENEEAVTSGKLIMIPIVK